MQDNNSPDIGISMLLKDLKKYSRPTNNSPSHYRPTFYEKNKKKYYDFPRYRDISLLRIAREEGANSAYGTAESLLDNFVDPRIRQYALDYAQRYARDRVVRKELPRDDIPDGVVGFTHANPSIPEFFRRPVELLPYEDGIHSGPAVDMHEITHIEIAKYNGIHDEKAINNHVAAKLGYARFPFSSY